MPKQFKMCKINSRQFFYAGISTGCFLISILPILQLQQKVLQYGFNNNQMDWIKGGCLFLSWLGFTISGVSASQLFLLNRDKKE